jgi:hypothetical protein
MLEEDYIMRLIREFVQALGILISRMKGKDDFDVHIQFSKFYTNYFSQQSDFFKAMSAVEMIEYVTARYKEKDRLPRIEMLAELLYSEGSLLSKKEESVELKDQLWRKAQYLYEYMQQNDDTYSLSRLSKIDEIKNYLV